MKHVMRIAGLPLVASLPIVAGMPLETKDAPEGGETTLEQVKAAFGEYHTEVKAFGDRLGTIEGTLEKIQKRAARPGGHGLLTPGSDYDPEQLKSFKSFMLSGAKAMSGNVDADGGFAVPEEIDRILSDQLVDISPMRRVASMARAGTPDYKRLMGVRGATSGWVGETDARSETDTPQLEEVAPTFGMVYAYPKVTEEIIDDVFFDLPSWLLENVSTEFAVQEGAAFTSGDGVKKPTGFLTGTPVATDDASRAFGTLQYVPSGDAAGFAGTNPGDALIDLLYKVRGPYRQGEGVAWQMNSATLATVRKFKDGDGNYLWQASTREGQPSTLMGYPIVENEDMPDIAADAFPLAFGNWRRGYLIADRVDTRITRDEVTTPGWVKFYVRRRVGGKTLDSHAIKLLKIATT